MFSWNRLFDAKHLYSSRAGNDSRDFAPETSLTTTAKREGSWDGIIASNAKLYVTQVSRSWTIAWNRHLELPLTGDKAKEFVKSDHNSVLDCAVKEGEGWGEQREKEKDVWVHRIICTPIMWPGRSAWNSSEGGRTLYDDYTMQICIYWTSCQDQRCIMLIDISSINKACIIIIRINTKMTILFVFAFISIFGKAKPWRILVILVKWRHRANGLLHLFRPTSIPGIPSQGSKTSQ